ncbi:MAG: hypothetical protein ACRD12_16090 [Acidimicrobiales bacterium]
MSTIINNLLDTTTALLRDLINSVVVPLLRPVLGLLPVPPIDELLGPLDLGTLLQKLPPVVDALTAPIESLLKEVASLPGTLLTVPPQVALGAVTYRVCTEAPQVVLSCSLPVPIALPLLVDVTGDRLPDVSAQLAPSINLFAPLDVGFSFTVARLPTAPAGPLPAHVVAVYDPILSGKRVQFGFDGRAETLANRATARVTIKNVLAAVRGDLNVVVAADHVQPGAVETATLAVKTLASGSFLQPLAETDPLVGALRVEGVPASLTAGLHVQGTADTDRATLEITSSSPTRVDALVTKDTTSQSPSTHKEYRLLVDKLPQRVVVDLVRQADTNRVDVLTSQPVAHLSASTRLVPDTSQAGTYNDSVYDVRGLPTEVHIEQVGGDNFAYRASNVLPSASFSTGAFVDGVLNTSTSGAVKDVPTDVRLMRTVDGNGVTTVAYDANGSLGEATVGLFDRPENLASLAATARGLPRHAVLRSNPATGAGDYSGSEPIGRLEATLSRAGGSTIDFAGDHVTVLKRGDQLGLDVAVSGLKSFHFDASQRATSEVTLAPGGQPFHAVVDADVPDVLARLDVSNLPATMGATVDVAAGVASYTAQGEVVDEVAAYYERRDTGAVATVEAEAVPAAMNLNFATGDTTPKLTYGASGRLGKLHAFYRAAPSAMAFDATVVDLPPYFTVEGADPFVFDARDRAEAPSGSSHLGALRFRYTTDEEFAEPPTTDDHLLVDVDSEATQVDLSYHGLRRVRTATTADKGLHVELGNTEKRLFRTYLDTPDLSLEGFVRGVPTDVTFDISGQTATYHGSSRIDEVAVDIDRRNGETVAIDVTDIPETVALTFDSVGSAVEWQASDQVGGLAALVRFGAPTTGSTRVFDASLVLAGIPRHWRASYGAGHPRFEGISGPIESLAATFTNHGTATSLDGDHANVVFESSTGDLDASVKVSGLALVDYEKLDNGAHGTVRLAEGGTLGLGARVGSADNRLTLTGKVVGLPEHLQFTHTDGVAHYQSNSSPDVQLVVGYGSDAAVAATPDPPSIHGFAIRDGTAGGSTAIKASMFLTGFPSELIVDAPAEVFTVSGFSPRLPVSLDARLNGLTSEPVILLATQHGIPAHAGFTLGHLNNTVLPDGTRHSDFTYQATGTLGRLTILKLAAAGDAYLDISSIPASISVGLDSADGRTKAAVVMTEGIASIAALAGPHDESLLTGSPPTRSWNVGVTLTDVPRELALTVASGASPVIYEASDAGMDLRAFVRIDPAALVQIRVDNLGKRVTVTANATEIKPRSSLPFPLPNIPAVNVHVESTPKTEYLSVSGALDVNLAKTWESPSIPIFGLGDRVAIAVAAKFFLGRISGAVTLSDFATVDLQLSVVSKIMQGDFREVGLYLALEQIRLTLSLVLKIFRWSIKLVDLPSLNIAKIQVPFRFAAAHEGQWFSISTLFPCGISIRRFRIRIKFFKLDVSLRPHPHHTGSTTGPPPGEEGGVWFATPTLGGFTRYLSDALLVIYGALYQGVSIGGGAAVHCRV